MPKYGRHAPTVMSEARFRTPNGRRRLSVLDLFAGPGGMSNGIMDAESRGAEFDVVVANDNNPAVRATYERNHAGVEFVFGSIAEEETKRNIMSAIKSRTRKTGVDVVVGGPPCKGFSFENKMTRNMDNPMNHLVLHYVDMIRRTRPAAFVMENVPGILAMQGGKVVETLIQKFKEIGYDNVNAWLLNAADYGVPQLRETRIHRRIQIRGTDTPARRNARECVLRDAYRSHRRSAKNPNKEADIDL